MITAEFIIGHSADDAEERKQEARKVFWALLAALIIHLLIGYGLAVYGGLLYAPFSVVDEEKPVELTFVDLSTPAPVVPDRYVQSDKSKQSQTRPEKADFESSVDSTAASELPPTGSEAVPTQRGMKSEALALDNQEYAPQEESKERQAAQETSSSQQMIKQPPPEARVEQFAMLRGTPSATAQPQSTPRPASSFREDKKQTRQSGSISNRGKSAVNAVGTSRGRYEKLMQDAIASRWYHYTDRQADLINLGTVDLTFTIDRSGRPTNIKIIENTSNEAFLNVCLRAIQEIKLPPIPEDVASTLPWEGLEEEYVFTMYAN